jgi:outer membrane immunogenic protein
LLLPSVYEVFMRRLSLVLTAAVSVIAFSQTATAAPPTPVAVALSWTGFYAGGNLGYGWGDASSDLSSLQPWATRTLFTMNGSYGTHFDGIVGGVQLGYNWQFLPNWVIGFEADWQASDQNGNSTFDGVIVAPLPPGTFYDPATTSQNVGLTWFGTVRGRFGFAWDHWLVYATGGLAYGRISVNGITNVANVTPLFPNPSVTFSDTSTNKGWTVGGGAEFRLNSRWSAKVEYLYIDLGDVTANGVIPPSGCYGKPGVICGVTSRAGSQTVTAHVTDNVIRVGINYHFN